ncbi:hypothetical protein C7N43_09250 [Sphingobacteriales bacterium UPWRP_1]|nr:hypothetical protein B6N25_07915 [Sphingobacteriales bacterium TSM_CSS]PSJ77315.1 hypothetical protein C7N43_09250 [Sphingobacteriales bacterium UPWRP_1]
MSNANICKRCLFCLLCATLTTNNALAQNTLQATDSVYRQEMDFGQYLLNNQQYADAQQVFAQLDTALANHLAATRTDSLHFYQGWACYNQKLLLPAAEQFLQVSGNSPFFHASRFFAAYNLTYKQWYAPAKGILTDLYLPPSDSLLHELQFFGLAGIALLQRNTQQFTRLSEQFTFTHYQLQQQEQNLLQYAESIKKVKRRSPALAGMLSAVVPGLGKVYAGKAKQGIASFFPVALLGLQAYENIHKRGIKNGFSIFYTGLFSVFYIGNIWGSVLSVQIKQQEIDHEIDNRILFDLHIPLRNIFGN